MIKIIFFDIDGTLRDSSTGRIPESAKAAVRRAKEAGIMTAVASGRHLLEMKRDALLEDLTFDVYVTMNGQYCIDASGKELYAEPIPADQVQVMVDMIHAHPFPCLFLEANDVYINMVNDHVRRVQADIQTSIPAVKPAETALLHPVYQMIPYLGAAHAGELAQRLPKCHAMLWADELAFDVNKKGVGKETGMAHVLAAYGFARAECAAIGDGYNDIGMIQTAGCGIAMGNAKDALKQAAAYVTDRVDADGLQKAVDWILEG